MPISASKRARLLIKKRQDEVNRRSLDGRGYFMDAGWEHHARMYIETGDPDHLGRLPQPRTRRA